MSIRNKNGKLIGNPKGYVPWNAGNKGYKLVTYHIKENGEIWACRKHKCYLIDGWLDNKGYRCYTIDNKFKFGHRLVAEKYLPNPNNLPQVDHINRVRHDNRVENLRWVSRQDNCDNRVFGGTIEQAVEFLEGHGYTIIPPL